ncbi:50S ribosomal protein L23 [Pseudenhygromyxa sp. WMMC2535]|uniref:50S ribosomal protein L23 n=1 Tax=Pseudenhygromyxa sp. WMMC2535 TaxID=2712867 RepID=UPI0015579187|nr:50S ribosomal protein L23 [Pseudenhygromyxa sp. WMMC2535]
MIPQEIIIRPILTEKSTELEAVNNQYTFEVHRAANKIEIRKAVEMVFGVRVDKVRTMVMRGNLRRVGRFTGKTRQWKKAVVTLHSGDAIDLYGED